MHKIIFISDSLIDINKAIKFSKENNYMLEYYSKEKWNNKTKTKTKNYSEFNKIQQIHPHLSIVPDINIQQHTMMDIKKTAIIKALFTSRGKVTQAAQKLKIGRATLYRKIKELDLNPNLIRCSLKEQINDTEFLKEVV